MDKQNNSQKLSNSHKKTMLPFVVHRAPLENHIAYQKKGHWTQKEKLKYVIFLSYFKQKFTSKDKKKRFCRIFKVMSDFIKTRTHNQCRSHHQKMQKQRFQVDTIIKNVVSKYHPRVYQELYERYLIEIENLNIEDHQEYKIKKINQNQVNQSSQSNSDNCRNDERKMVNKKPKEIYETKRIEILQPAFKTKQEDDAQMILQKPLKPKRELRLTQECEQDQKDNVIMKKNNCYDFPPQNVQFSEKQKSLYFGSNNNMMGMKFDQSNQYSMNFSQYIQSLQMRKLALLSKANFHYTQMQVELNNVAECQKQKSLIIEQQQSKLNQQKYYNFGFSSFLW